MMTSMRLLLVILGVVLALPEGASAQAQGRACPGFAGCQPPVLREHADGGEIPVFVGGAALLGWMVYDIATAPASARAYNDAHARQAKSPSTAFLLSLTSTAVPLAAGMVAFDQGLSGGTPLSLVGGGLVVTGVVLGPSTGHWYAGRRQLALRNAGLRGVLFLGILALESCCT